MVADIPVALPPAIKVMPCGHGCRWQRHRLLNFALSGQRRILSFRRYHILLFSAATNLTSASALSSCLSGLCGELS
jgi:hypothetical protein